MLGCRKTQMPVHLIFFAGALAFLSGIAFASLGLLFWYSFIPATIVCGVFCFYPRTAPGAGVYGGYSGVGFLAALLLIFGSLYYFADDYRYLKQLAALPVKIEATTEVASDPVRDPDAQSFYIETDTGKLLVKTVAYPRYDYGDLLALSGRVAKPAPDSYGRHLAKEHVVGTIENPQIKRVSAGYGDPFFAFLYRVKDEIRQSYSRLLNPDEAALLAGMTLGASGDISKNFLNNLSVAGVRHLVVVNGLHMVIVIAILSGALSYFLPRRYAFALTLVFAGLFAALTGLSVSAIRATLMGSIAALGREIGRERAAHNALTLAAAVLVLLNPKTLLFDAGFQLSFLAATAIVYVSPLVRSAIRLGSGAGFLKWKEALTATLSAQLLTAPILIVQFQNFSLLAFAANVFILVVVPYILVLGLLAALASFIFMPAAALCALLVAPLVDYVMLIVNLFARWAVAFNPPLGFTGVVLYYATIVAVLYWFYRKENRSVVVPVPVV